MKAKIITLLIVLLILIIFISLNTHLVEINFLFGKFQMSAIILISISLLIGLIIGFILNKIIEKPRVRQENIRKDNNSDLK
ncbi:MAG: DUF1049 domain-containing protein [Ignavibacteriales bacterium]|nr:MAG: DUF1049 domain-containing protein [Ignavibacteriales bacterium]